MFKGLGNLGNIASLVGSLQEIPERLKAINEQMKAAQVSATSSCSRVEVVMNGIGQAQSVQIAGDLQGSDLEQAMLEATNAAGAAAKQLYAEAVAEMAKEMNLNVPGVEGVLATLTGAN